MGTITVSISEDVEQRLRKHVRKTGQQKGSLGRNISRAVEHWLDEQEQKKIGEELHHLLDKGFAMGRLLYKRRAELYDRPY
ncbi:hypothetical protein HY490_05365 [Candidatus Woesearchaeota archaeon]|nr:hypothetical protein [Candidatus Woesearchaeota archaeon]